MFTIAAVMRAGRIWSLEARFSARGYYAMSALMLVCTTGALSKALWDKEEAERICK